MLEPEKRAPIAATKAEAGNPLATRGQGTQGKFEDLDLNQMFNLEAKLGSPLSGSRTAVFLEPSERAGAKKSDRD